MRAEGQVSGRREGEELGPLGPAELITSGPRLCEERGARVGQVIQDVQIYSA